MSLLIYQLYLGVVFQQYQKDQKCAASKTKDMSDPLE